jgi:protein TonB
MQQTIENTEREDLKLLLIPRKKRKEGVSFVTFLLIALLVHVLAFLWFEQHGQEILHKKALVFNVHILKEAPPPKPKPKLKLPPPPKPKPQPKPLEHPKPQAAAPKLKMTQVKFHVTPTKGPAQPSNLISVEESKGGSKYGNPEGVAGGKGPVESTGTTKQGAPTPPPPPPPHPTPPPIPDRKLPIVTSRCKPQYPEQEMEEGVQGTVQLEVLIGTQGQVLNVTVVQSSGNYDLDNAAVQAVKNCWTFEPAIQGGKPVEARLSFPIQFVLQQ